MEKTLYTIIKFLYLKHLFFVDLAILSV